MSTIAVDDFYSLRGRLWRYGPPLVWSALIFLFSSSLLSASNTGTILRPVVLWVFPNTSEATLALLHFLIRKAAHFTEYAILALLAARALRTSSHKLLRHRWFLLSLVFVILYSLSDEFHQSFVSTRSASVYDSLIDSAGGLTALVWLALRQRVSSPRVSKG
jgi:VanZ family protein